MKAAGKLGDREALVEALKRVVPGHSPADIERIRLILAVGTREEILALEVRLRDLPPPIVRLVLPVLAQQGAQVGDRIVRDSLTHPALWIRDGAVKAIGAARLEQFLPELSAMAITETPDVRDSALRSLRAFEKKVWLPVYREALRITPQRALRALEDAVQEGPVTELGKELSDLLDRPWGRWATHLLDATMNRDKYMKWSGIEVPHCAGTLVEMLEKLDKSGVRAELSLSARRHILLQVKLESGVQGEAGKVLALISVEPEIGKKILLTHLSDSEGIRIVTFEEAVEYWRARLEKD